MKKYSFRRKYKRIKEDNSEYWAEWSSELYNTKEEIKNMCDYEIERDKEWNAFNFRWLNTIAYEIEEVEIKTLNIEGDVLEYGEYEDYTVAIGDTPIGKLLIDKFEGQKVKITIEVIEE